jgi:hypothetical protein
MLFSRIEVSEYARKVGKTERTLWRWIKQGCNPRDPKSLREWQVRNQIRETPIERARKRRRDNESHNIPFSAGPQTSCDQPGNGELPPIGKKGAAAALERLEHLKNGHMQGLSRHYFAATRSRSRQLKIFG